MMQLVAPFEFFNRSVNIYAGQLFFIVRSLFPHNSKYIYVLCGGRIYGVEPLKGYYPILKLIQIIN